MYDIKQLLCTFFIKMRFLYILLFVTIIYRPVLGQVNTPKNNFKDNLYINAQVGKGVLVAHRSSLRPIVNDYPQYIILEVAKTTYGNKSWQALYNFPSLGIGYYHGSLGNNEILGKANALYGFIEAPYYKEKHITILYKFGFGLSYLSKKFDLENNIYNSAIGSHFNVLVHLSFDAKINLLKKDCS